jgi:hypothetical protein
MIPIRCAVLVLVVFAGCGRLVSIDYEAANVVKGEGIVRVAPFRYEPFETHRVRPRQVETHPEAKSELFMVDEIGAFFADALKKELLKSGYTVNDLADRVLSGMLTRFYLDWSSDQMDRSFQLGVDYTVSRKEEALFTWQCSSVQQAPNQMGKDGPLIRKGIADCMQRFLEAAQQAHVL